MSRCWTCGSSVGGWSHTCSSCKGLHEIKKFGSNIESHHGNISEKLDYLTEIQQESFNALMNTFSTGLAEIASAIEWGFGELSWQLQLQTDILKSIDHTLKTPSETKANEWRLHAEELKRRGILEESEEFYQKALNEFRLDYRIYVGLSETYLMMNKFDKAKMFLEKSLPHAPKKGIDYKSYSYRLIGHIYACEENYAQAALSLESSLQLSPQYEDGFYDYAQYCAQLKDKEKCISFLHKAILAKPLFWYISKNEKNFEAMKFDITNLLSNIYSETYLPIKEILENAEVRLKEASEKISLAKQAQVISKVDSPLDSINVFENAKNKFSITKDKLATDDYLTILEVKPIAQKIPNLIEEAINTALNERVTFTNYVEAKKRLRLKKIPLAYIIIPLIFGYLGASIIGMIIDEISHSHIGIFIGGMLGVVGGFLFGKFIIIKKLE